MWVCLCERETPLIKGVLVCVCRCVKILLLFLQKSKTDMKGVWREREHAVTQCNTLQHTATHCNTLQHTATHCNTLPIWKVCGERESGERGRVGDVAGKSHLEDVLLDIQG